MKKQLLLCMLVPFIGICQRTDLPLYSMYPTTVLKAKKVKSISKRVTMQLSDSVLLDKITEQVFFNENGEVQRHTRYNEWTDDSTVTNFQNHPERLVSERAVYHHNTALRQLLTLTHQKDLPVEMIPLTEMEVDTLLAQPGILEFWFCHRNNDAGYQGVVRYEALPQDYFYPTGDNDSLDTGIFIRIDSTQNKITFQEVSIYNPPTSVPHTTYDKKVFHYSFELKLLWIDIEIVGLEYGLEGLRSEPVQVLFDYYENGLIKQALSVQKQSAYYFPGYQQLLKKYQYNITYW